MDEHEDSHRAHGLRRIPLAGRVALAGAVALAAGATACAPHQSGSASTTSGGGTPGTGVVVARSNSISVRVRVSSALQRVIGSSAELTVPLAPGSTVGVLLNRLGGTYPALDAMGPSILVAVGDEAQPPSTVLSDGAMVDLISQMAGG